MSLHNWWWRTAHHSGGSGNGFLTILTGALIGGTAGFIGGWIDDVLSLLTNVFLVIPGLPLMIIIATWLPAGPLTLMAVMVFTGWAWTARIVRAQTSLSANGTL